MTVSANSLPDLQRDEIIQAALWLVGDLEASQAVPGKDAAMGMQLFRLLLDKLQAEGSVLRTIERTTLTLVSGTSEYTLASDTIDVEIAQNGVVGMIIPSTGTGESPVMAMRADEWMQISNKTTVGPARPTSVYVEKLASVSLVFYPPPGSESASFRYRRVRLLKDVDTGSNTVDLPSRWTYALTMGLAALIARAKSADVQRVEMFDATFEAAKKEARREDVERGPTRLRIVHSNKNWR